MLQNSETMFNYKVGTIFTPIEPLNLYVTYGTSSNPSSEYGVLDSGTATLAPESNTTAEAGFKAMLLNNQLTVTGAIFQTMKTNTRVATDTAAGLPPTVLGGEQRVQGYTLGGATANLTKDWNITASFTHLDSEIMSVGPAPTVANLQTLGKQLPNTPPNSFSFWTSYNVTKELLVGFGGTYNDNTFANATNTVYVPSYWAFDAMASYQISKNFQVQLNVYKSDRRAVLRAVLWRSGRPAAGRTGTSPPGDLLIPVPVSAAAPLSGRGGFCVCCALRGVPADDDPYSQGADPGAGRPLSRRDGCGGWGGRALHRRRAGVHVKKNLQLPDGSAEARELGEMVRAALQRSALFTSAVLPRRILPPMFNAMMRA